MVEHVEQNSYDYFDALSHLGRIAYAQQQYDDAAGFVRKAAHQKLSENEYIIDTWFWIARTHLKRNDGRSAKGAPGKDRRDRREVRAEERRRWSCCREFPRSAELLSGTGPGRRRCRP